MIKNNPTRLSDINWDNLQANNNQPMPKFEFLDRVFEKIEQDLKNKT